MDNVILLAACFVAGILLHHGRRMPGNTPAALNAFIIHISLPALVLLHIHDLKLDSNVGFLAAMGWLQFILAVVAMRFVGRRLGLPRSTEGALILTAGLGNTSFLGLPMIEAFYGKEAIATGIVVDQLGSFLALSILGIITAGLYSSGVPSGRAILRRIVLFPPFLALLGALALMPVTYPDWSVTLLKRLGDTLAPLALLSVGFQLRLGHLAGNGRNLALGLGFKLFLVPLLIFLLYVPILGARGQEIQVTLFESAMPPMITAAILAAEHDLDPPLASLMVAVGLLLSFFTLAGWWWVLRGV